MRLFIAIDIDQPIRERIAAFVEDLRPFAPEARWVKAESWHITLKFLGEQPDPSVETIQRALHRVEGRMTDIHFRGFGFYPTAKSRRVFWIGIEAGPALSGLAAAIDDLMPGLGIAKEDRAFTPHLTLARRAGGSGSPSWRSGDRPNRAFQALEQKLSSLPPPEFGSMPAREFFLYRSRLSPQGSQYTKLAGFRLQ
jgi:RNA 2',3'-cyclic 3'-phosphodiesterase